MSSLPNCPQCDGEYTYEDRDMFVCPSCNNRWSMTAETSTDDKKEVIRDASGNELHDGDTVTLIKSLKVKGSSTDLKMGTKVKNIRLISGDHNIDCRIEGFGAMQLKSEFVRKA